jgi:hypothetical protein
MLSIVKFAIACSLITAIEGSLLGQQLLPARVEPARVSGTVTDTNGGIIPGAQVVLQGPGLSRTVVASDSGVFEIDNLSPGVPYRITVIATGFADWKSPDVVLDAGQFYRLADIRLTALGENASVVVVASREEIAAEQVKAEEHQRVLGFVPNFYVSYDKNAVPLTAKLKFELAMRVSVDPVTFGGTGFLALMNQAAHYPNFQEGMKGYGQRFGAIYADGLTDIMVGGALLPSVLHQDPRYFYQGTGTTKSRLLHALSSPLICRGDNGRWQPNYSSLGGYLAAGAMANAYYPNSNRGAGLVFNTFAVDLSANIANGVLQEFVLRKLTPAVKKQN